MNPDITRRLFLGTGTAALAGCAVPKAAAFAARPEPKFMWGVLLHFGLNIQSDIPVDKWGGKKYFGEDLKLMTAADHVRFDEGVFDRLTDCMAAKGLNTIVIDLEEALYYPSHPELAVKGTWSVDRFQKKLAQLPEGRECNYAEAYIELEKAGFDQIPTGSNWSVNDNVSATVSFAKKHIAPERLKGFLAAQWVKTLPQFEKMHEEQIDQMHDVMKLV